MSGADPRFDRWLRRRRLQLWTEAVSAASAVALTLGVLLGLLTPLTWPIAAAAGGGVGGLLLFVRRRRLRVRPAQLAAHLDRRVPEVEESSALLLESEEGQPLLRRLQRRRVVERLPADGGLLPRGPWLRAAGWWAGSLSLAAVLLQVVPASRETPPRVESGPRSAVAPVAAPNLVAVEIEVRPPDYTGRPPRRVGELSVDAEAGAEIVWRLRTEGDVETAELVFDDDDPVVLEAVGEGSFTATRTVEASRLYWVRLAAGDDRAPFRSAYGRLRLIPDRAPEVELVVPSSRVEEVAPGTPTAPVRVRARDDYGVARMELVVTLAAGSGELVRFRERRMPLRRRSTATGEPANATTELDLGELGMEPGSELYLVAEAWDERRPQANRGRSDARILRMPGPRPRSVDLGAGLPVVQPPEFFRSQRQIILDTERLVADRPRITREELSRRSQALGFDQRALRMRYGGLLGEEFESGLPGEEEEEDGEWLEEEEGGLSAALEALPEGFVHSHDWAEVNTFFDDEVRTLLKEALREMWGAEEKLRSIEPGAALPFEYRALAALKSAQEAERVYVRKTGFEPPPLDMERRLTGELDEVESRRVREEAPGASPPPALLRALAAARRLRADPEAVPDDFAALMRQVAERLAAAGGAAAEADLELLERLREWRLRPPERVARADAERLESALWSLLPPPPAPSAIEPDPRRPLWRAYRERLGEDG